MLSSRKKLRISRFVVLLLSVLVTSLVVAHVIVQPVNAQFDYNAFLGSPISDGEIDGVIGNEWNDADISDVIIEPQVMAEIRTKHDGTYLYVAVQFTADSSNPWVAIQFESSAHMASGADGALFGHDEFGANEYRDISLGGLGSISIDSVQDGVGEINVGESNLVTVELKKPLNSGDSAGDDINWNVGNTYTLIIIWDSNGGGSSGGDTSHRSGSTVNKTIYINTDEIPEFSSLTLAGALITVAGLIVILKKRSQSLISQNH